MLRSLGFPLVALALVNGCAAAAPEGGSIGAILERESRSGAVVADDVPRDLAGARAGLRRGDRIKMIDGVLVDTLGAKEVVALLRGPVGSVVTLTVIRGEAVVELTVVREPRVQGVEPVPERQRLE